MKVLCILTIWNEIDYLPLKIQYCKENKLDLYIIDNMSDDGSWEWLQKNNIPSHRFDTDGAFSLGELQNEIIKTIHKIKPDWAIYNGCDTFPVTLEPLYDVIERIDKEGYNLAWIDLINFLNTGEERNGFDPLNTFFYYNGTRRLRMIHKYAPNIRYNGDTVYIPNEKSTTLNGVMVNYGNTGTAEERNKTLERRKKAWKKGTPRGFGTHYLEGQKRNWLWDKTKLTDVRKTKYYPYIQKLQKMLELN